MAGGDDAHEVKEAPEKSGADVGDTKASRESQEKSDTQQEAEQKKESKRRQGASPSSVGLPKVELSIGPQGTTAAKFGHSDRGDSNRMPVRELADAKQVAPAPTWHFNEDGSSVGFDNQGRVTTTVDAKGITREFGYGPDGSVNEFRTPPLAPWKSTDGKHWANGNGFEFEGTVAVLKDGSFKSQSEGAATIYRLDGKTEQTAKDKSVIVEGANGKIEKTIDATGKARTFEYASSGKVNRVIEEEGSDWSTQDGHTWTATDGRTWSGSIEVEEDGTYRYIDDDNLKETIKRSDGTVTEKEANGRITDTAADGTTKVVQEAINREGLTRLAERLHDGLDDDRDLQGKFGRNYMENRRKELAREGGLLDLHALNEAEREALKGIYHQKYGRTLDSDYSFLEGGQKEEFDALINKDSDPVASKADRLVAAMDKSYGDYSSFSYANTDRENANKEIRSTLSSMNSDEIEELDRHFRKVYGTTLRDAINKDTPPATREFCEIYLKGTDQRKEEDEVRLGELRNKERREVDGVPNPDLKAAMVKDLFENNFDELDRDNDGFVSKREIDRAMVSSDFKGEDAQLVAMLKARREDLEELSDDEWGDENDGVTRADIHKFADIAAKEERTEEEQKLVRQVDADLIRAHKGMVNANRDLFANKDDPLKSINPEAVKQGGIGDCYFLAAVASVAQTPEGKESIKNMIEDNGDGTYTVTFPGDPENPVTVNAPTDAELGHYAAGSKDGTWVAVLEKAYGKYNDADNVDRHDSIPDGSVTARGLKILTGKYVDRDELGLTSLETTHEKLKKAMADGCPVTASTYNEISSKAGLADNKTDDAGLPGGHDYSVLEYNPETRMVKVRNPWGRGEPTGEDGKPLDGKEEDGVFYMTLEQFDKNFGGVCYVEK